MEEGKIFKFHNDLDTDQIIASQYLLLPNLDEMKGHETSAAVLQESRHQAS